MTDWDDGRTPPPTDRPPSMGRLVEQLSEQATRLVRAEIALAKAELADKAKRSAIGLGLLVVAAVIVLYAVGVLIWAGIIGLAEAWPLWLSALVIGVALMLVAAVLGLAGARLLQRVAHKPEAIDRVKDDVTAIKEGMHR
jgi:Flp pilus assembly protein TadB